MSKYIRYSLLGLMLSFLTVIFKTDSIDIQAYNYYDALRLLSDAFFMPGVLLISVGGLILASKNGLFDLFYYTVSAKAPHKEQTFGEFKASRSKRNKNPVPMIITGAGFLAVAVLFCCFYLV